MYREELQPVIMTRDNNSINRHNDLQDKLLNVFSNVYFVSELAKNTIHDPINWRSTNRCGRTSIKALKMMYD